MPYPSLNTWLFGISGFGCVSASIAMGADQQVIPYDVSLAAQVMEVIEVQSNGCGLRFMDSLTVSVSGISIQLVFPVTFP